VDPVAVLSALAELAPAGRDRVLDVTGGRTPVWLPHPRRVASHDASHLAAIDVLHRDERLVRRGWGYLLGTIDVAGDKRRVRLPLLSEPVRLRRSGSDFEVVPAGDLKLTPLLDDRERAAALEAAAVAAIAEWGSPRYRDPVDPARDGWVGELAEAIGLPVTELVTSLSAHQWRKSREPAEGLLGIACAALYVARDVFSGSQRDSLLNWRGRPGVERTALAAVYRTDPLLSSTSEDREEVLSPLPLNAAQAEVVRRARADPVAVVSGPPGNGKSHAVVAAALDVVDRGGSVLVATQSTHAADVLGELLDRYPGPTPVLFGDAEHRAAIANELAEGVGAGYPDRALRSDQAAVEAAAARVRQLTAAIDAALELERLAATLADWEPLLPGLRTDAPGAFVPGADLDTAAALLDQLGQPVTGWWGRRRQRRARRRLHATLGNGPAVPPDQLRAAIEAGRAGQAADRLGNSGGTDLAAAWQALHRAGTALAEAVGTAMRHRAASAQRWRGPARRSAAALVTALRAGRNRRRQLLAGMDGEALVRALPLWIGTAADTEDLLPPVPGLFDLVILDEASHLDQLRSAPVLARARRALVVGDPRQLRFVSFVSDVDVAATLRRHGLDDRVDVRRVSAFDLAAGAAPVTWLEEHYRSVPHLIEFSADRFYTGRISVATRHPANDGLDVIDVIRTGDEVAATVSKVRELAAVGVTSIGVVSPFRAHADALEAALVEAFPVEELARLGLRVGTVHAFQGSEAHTVVAALGLADDDSPSRVRFVADPHLFNVLVTRARERMVVVTALTTAGGLVGDYLSVSEAPPPPPDPTPPADAWTGALATELARAVAAVCCDYPVGRWRVDLCLGTGVDAVGLVTRPHPDGPAAHRARQRSLTGAGWRLVDAYPSRWGGDPVRAALELSA
jgi:hypothetical protein